MWNPGFRSAAPDTREKRQDGHHDRSRPVRAAPVPARPAATDGRPPAGSGGGRPARAECLARRDAGGEPPLAGHAARPAQPGGTAPLPLRARRAGELGTPQGRRPGVRRTAVAAAALARSAVRGDGRPRRRRVERMAGPRTRSARPGVGRRPGPAPVVLHRGRGRQGLRPRPADGGQCADPLGAGPQRPGRPPAVRRRIHLGPVPAAASRHTSDIWHPVSPVPPYGSPSARRPSPGGTMPGEPAAAGAPASASREDLP